ncbi:MAG: cytochrome c [Bryobacterales bacterium]|nr:cytochrome c [Bryobacterales bacterium]
MKPVLLTSAALFFLHSPAPAQSVEEYRPLMQSAAVANGKMQKSLGSDLTGTAPLAAEVQAEFKKIEAFWAKHNVADAQKFARNVQQAAVEVETAAKSGNQQEAAAAAKKIGANCQGCHMAHRDKGPDGKFIIK